MTNRADADGAWPRCVYGLMSSLAAGSGEIDFEEFQELMREQADLRKRLILENWDKFDRDRDNAITHHELGEAIAFADIRCAVWQCVCPAVVACCVPGSALGKCGP